MLNKEREGDVLVVSYIGYKKQMVTVGAERNYNIVMTPDSELMDEVVVIGYGTQRKSHLTGAVSKVENKKLDQIAVSRVDDALIGQVSGVNIQATSAEAGAAPTVTIRGFGSITAASGPAVVVDGLVVDPDFLGNLDMNDVESFEILKDAASAAIYGSEGSNGVIMITTKSGKAGKTKFSYETFGGRKEAFGSEAYRKSVADWAAKEMAETGELSNTTLYAQKIVEATGIDRDWQDVFFDGGYITSHSFSARGGSEKTTFSTSLRTLGDEGVVLTDNYRLYSAKLKMDTRITNRLKFGVSAIPSYSKRRALPTSIHNPIRQSPWLPIYHTDQTLQFIDTTAYPDVGVGDYFLENHLVNLDINEDGSTSRPRTSGDMNPYAQYVEREHYEYKTNVLGSTYLSYKIIDGLTAKTSLGITLENRKRTRWNGTKHHAQASRASYELQNRVRTRVISDNTLAYNKAINNHEIGVLVGHYIYNNYFYELDDRPIYIQNENSDPLDNINIAFNTIVDCSEIILGGDGNDQPTNVTFANNIFTDPDDNIFEDPTGTETWIGNISSGNLGIPFPESGITMTDPQLEENSAGFLGLAQNSPAINAAQAGYTMLPQFTDIEDIDTEILFDIMGQNRPLLIEEKDIGCNEYPHNILIQPIATEENTGPSYNTSTITNIQNTISTNKNFAEIDPNPVANQLNITIYSTTQVNIVIDILNTEGKKVSNTSKKNILPGETTLSKNIENLPTGLYNILITSQNHQGELEKIQTIKFIKK